MFPSPLRRRCVLPPLVTSRTGGVSQQGVVISQQTRLRVSCVCGGSWLETVWKITLS